MMPGKLVLWCAIIGISGGSIRLAALAPPWASLANNPVMSQISLVDVLATLVHCC
jgi:hypothetical protein